MHARARAHGFALCAPLRASSRRQECLRVDAKMWCARVLVAFAHVMRGQRDLVRPPPNPPPRHTMPELRGRVFVPCAVPVAVRKSRKVPRCCPLPPAANVGACRRGAWETGTGCTLGRSRAVRLALIRKLASALGCMDAPRASRQSRFCAGDRRVLGSAARAAGGSGVHGQSFCAVQRQLLAGVLAPLSRSLWLELLLRPTPVKHA